MSNSVDATVYELASPLNLITKEVSLDPKSLNAHDVYAVTEFSAVSPGTEIAAWLGLPPLRPSTTYPRLIGYCNLARVAAVGSKVRNFSTGDLILTHQSHRSAFLCHEDEVLLRIDANDEAMKKKLTATYLYHLGYSALMQGDFRPGHQVAIVGMGTLGLTTASLLAVFGCKPFLVSNQSAKELPPRLVASSFCCGKDADSGQRIRSATGMDGVDLVINTSNKWSDHLFGMQLARKGATIVNMGFPGRGEPEPDFNPLDSQYYYDKQITFKHCGYTPDTALAPIDIRFTKKRNLQYLADLILRGLLDPSDVLSMESHWSELKSVYETLASRKPGYYSAVIKWV